MPGRDETLHTITNNSWRRNNESGTKMFFGKTRRFCFCAAGNWEKTFLMSIRDWNLITSDANGLHAI